MIAIPVVAITARGKGEPYDGAAGGIDMGLWRCSRQPGQFFGRCLGVIEVDRDSRRIHCLSRCHALLQYGDDPAADRRYRAHPLSPLATLTQLAALVVLGRLPVPVLAIDREGTIIF